MNTVRRRLTTHSTRPAIGWLSWCFRAAKIGCCARGRVNCPKRASTKLCTFGARLSVATHFQRVIEVVPDDREQAQRSYDYKT
ncbi:MAG TPA: hypothetical protein VFQ47_05865, partial [Nitrososphaera sp.]|nr:hypothetical protein [Nitrososphaera sp.]